MDINLLKDKAILLIKKEKSLVKLQKVLGILGKGYDVSHMKKVEYLATAGGNVGYFFSALKKAEVYSSAMVYRLMGRKTHGAYYRIVKTAERRIEEGDTRDITKNNIHYKLAIVLNKLVKKGKLPIRDDGGNPIPITLHHCVVKDPVNEILKLFKELQFNGRRDSTS